MALVGRRAWALAGWLDRIMLNVDVEGEKLRHVLEARREEAADSGGSGGSAGSTRDEQEAASSPPIRHG